MIEITHPVIGPLRPWRGRVYPTHFQEFDNGLVKGLACVRDDGIEFMAVDTHCHGAGHFRDFIRDLKQHYTHIRFWAMLNGKIVAILWRYGFTSGYDASEFGEITDCMDWTKGNEKEETTV